MIEREKTRPKAKRIESIKTNGRNKFVELRRISFFGSDDK